MPYYDYKCTACGLIFEIQKGMNESADPRCPECKSSSQRVFSIPRTLRSYDEAGSEQSGSCDTCSSGVCSTCSAK